MNEILQFFKGYRELQGWSRSKIADELGIPESTYRRYELGLTDITIDFLDKFLEVFPDSAELAHLSLPKRLLRITQTDRSYSNEHDHQHVNESRVDYRLASDFINLPFHSSPIRIDGVVSEDGLHLKFLRSFIQKEIRSQPEDLFVWKSKDNTMHPLICYDGVVLVDKSRKKVSLQPRVFMIQMAEEWFLRMVTITEDPAKIKLSTLEKNMDFVLFKENIQIIGQVVWSEHLHV